MIGREELTGSVTIAKIEPMQHASISAPAKAPQECRGDVYFCPAPLHQQEMVIGPS